MKENQACPEFLEFLGTQGKREEVGRGEREAHGENLGPQDQSDFRENLGRLEKGHQDHLDHLVLLVPWVPPDLDNQASPDHLGLKDHLV